MQPVRLSTRARLRPSRCCEGYLLESNAPRVPQHGTRRCKSNNASSTPAKRKYPDTTIPNDQVKKLTAQRASMYQSYSNADKEALKRKYSPEQLKIIELAEAAIPIKDLATQAKVRRDVYRPEYLDDYARIQPTIDKKLSKIRGDQQDYEHDVGPATIITEDEIWSRMAELKTASKNRGQWRRINDKEYDRAVTDQLQEELNEARRGKQDMNSESLREKRSALEKIKARKDTGPEVEDDKVAQLQRDLKQAKAQGQDMNSKAMKDKQAALESRMNGPWYYPGWRWEGDKRALAEQLVLDERGRMFVKGTVTNKTGADGYYEYAGTFEEKTPEEAAKLREAAAERVTKHAPDFQARVDAKLREIEVNGPPDPPRFSTNPFVHSGRTAIEQAIPDMPDVAPDLPRINDPSVKYTNEAERPESETIDEEAAEAELRTARQLGINLEQLKKYRTRILTEHRVVNQTRLGKISSIYALAVAGDGKGLVGLGEGKSADFQPAQRMARLNAIKAMAPILRYESRTIYGEVRGKSGASEVVLSARPPGFGVRTNAHIFDIATCAGITDLHAKVPRGRNPMNMAKAVWQALLSQRHPDEIARARGKKLVDVRKVYYAGKV